MSHESVREWLLRQPFEPFVLNLSNGERYEVRHPENLALGRNRLAVADPDSDTIAHIALIHINSIHPLRAA